MEKFVTLLTVSRAKSRACLIRVQFLGVYKTTLAILTSADTL